MGDSFTGTYRFQRDERGRMVIPKKMRMRSDGMLYAKFVVTIGPDKCLAIFPMATFREYLEKHKDANISPRESVAFRRTVFPNTEEVEVDSHGRILLPQEICAKLGIGKEVIIMGSDDWIEVWDPGKYEKYQEQLLQESQEALINFYGVGAIGKGEKDDDVIDV